MLTVCLCAHGEVKFDGSTGKLNAADLARTYQNIPFENGTTRGPNLFHSFEYFKVNPRETVTFKDRVAPVGVKTENIIARVTGGADTRIDGTLKSEISGANLYLINPKGITFGNGATLAISGSFFASSASHLKFGAAGELPTGSKTPPAESLSVSPTGFGFSGGTPGVLSLESGAHLSGAAGKTVGLAGGDVTLKGANVTAPQGSVQVSSVGQGDLVLSPVAGQTSIRLAAKARGGNIRLEEGAFIGDMTGDLPNGLARAEIAGGSLTMLDSAVLISASRAGEGVFVNLQRGLTASGGSLAAIVLGDLRGQTVMNVSAASASFRAFSSVIAQQVGLAQGGDVRLALSGRLELQSSNINLINDQSRDGGSLFVRADSALVRDSGISSLNSPGTRVGAYQIDIANDLDLERGVLSLETNNGSMNIRAGSLSIHGYDPKALTGLIMFNDLTPGESGGRLRIEVRDKLSIYDGGRIDALALGRSGRTVDITAGEVFLSGRGTAANVRTGIIGRSNGAAGATGGQVLIRAEGKVQVLDGATISTDTLGPGMGGDILVEADALTVTGRPGTPGTFVDPRGITAQNQSNLGGPSGRITLDVNTLEVKDGGEINASTQGTGRGGSIEVRGRSASITSGGQVFAETIGPYPTGIGGDVSLQLSGDLQIGTGGSISVRTLGAATGGNLHVQAKTVRIESAPGGLTAASGSATQAVAGAGGDIQLQADLLDLRDGGQISASTYGIARGGSVEVTAGRVQIEGDDTSASLSGLSAQTLGRGASGTGGRLSVTADSISLSGGGARLTTSSAGTGRAGAILLQADRLQMERGSAIQSSSSGLGTAGAISGDFARDLLLRSGSTISVDARNASAGDIDLRAGERIQLDHASITAEAGLTGGSLRLRARDLLYLRNSRVTAAAESNGGNIEIDPELIVLERSLIDARAVFENGGRIRLHSDFFIDAPGNLITATSQFGIDGEVDIDALNIDLTGSLVELPGKLLNAQSMLRELCTMKLDEFNSFVSQGRGGLPPLPGGALPSLEIIP